VLRTRTSSCSDGLSNSRLERSGGAPAAQPERWTVNAGDSAERPMVGDV
jgi:hypothetical protein